MSSRTIICSLSALVQPPVCCTQEFARPTAFIIGRDDSYSIPCFSQQYASSGVLQRRARDRLTSLMVDWVSFCRLREALRQRGVRNIWASDPETGADEEEEEGDDEVDADEEDDDEMALDMVNHL